MEINQNKKFLLGFIFGGLFACFFLLLFGQKQGGKLLEKLLEDSTGFENALREKFRNFRSSNSPVDKITDKITALPQLLTRGQRSPLRSISSPITDDFQTSGEKLSFTKSIKHYFRKDGKTLTS